MKSSRLLLSSIAVLALWIPSAHAVVEVFNLDFVFSGTPPAATSPWAKITLQDGLAPNTVRLTMDATNLSGTEFISEWSLNLNTALDPNQLSFAIVSNPSTTFSLADVHTGVDAFQADGDGKYDVLFDFPPPPGSFSAKFTAGEQVVLDVTRVGGLAVSDFLYQSTPGGPNGVFYSAVHIQGIGPSGTDSSWIGTTMPAAAVPEASTTAVVLGLATFGLVLCSRRGVPALGVTRGSA